MSFANPIWLLTLIPWAALAIWMLWGRRERVAVPFIALWRDREARPSSRKAVQPPPLALVLILLCILLAILAAAGPMFAEAGHGPITIVLDRGITMSARDGDTYRFRRAARDVESTTLPASVIHIQPVPGTQLMADRATLRQVLDAIPPTAYDTSNDVTQSALAILHTRGGPVVVITDRWVEIDDPRLIVVPPPPLTANVGIAHVAARERPAPQVMAKVRTSGTSGGKVGVVVSSDGERVERAVDVLAGQQEATAFVDAPRLGRTVEVALAQGDALEADDRAWLVREGGWPRIEVIADVPPELRRMIDAYRKLRPAREDARVVSIVDSPEAAPGEAVILGRAEAVPTDTAPPRVVDHPITGSHVQWADALRGAKLGGSPPAGFTPLVNVGGRVAVAVREQPGRKVWVAIDSPSFPLSADYVVFWADVLEWLGQGEDAFVSQPVGLLGRDWRRVTDGPDGTEPGLWPGVYERPGEALLRAVNAAHVNPPAAPMNVDWRARLARAASAGRGGRAVAPQVLLVALACALGAALAWPSRRGASA